jgi:predicted DNA-binding transcriptional regulator AlpA
MSVHPPNIPLGLLRTEEAAHLMGLSRRTLEKHRTYGTGPRYLKLGGRVVYKVAQSPDLV